MCGFEKNEPLQILLEDNWRYDSATGKTLGPIFDSELESGVNEQINYELSAHYTYLSMSYHFDQDEYYLPGFSKFFKEMAEEEHEHAQIFMKYQNKRGGKIRLNSIPSPCNDGYWGNGTEAMKSALRLEQLINEHLINLHSLGEEKAESQFLDFLESNFLGEQVDSIKEISNYVHILRKIDSPLGEFQFDQLTLGGACGRQECKSRT
ncbi:soma ferritin-like [Dendronephthya gigantea]|uniref:soma ferritin-like n=1 Tax=Dendronephthya gigantea TaxID=151771 RepID=UPI00106AD031|nr:soma ferritin-like [Dendronephthya gigantea]